MPVTPTGHLSLPLDYLRKTVAASASFQSWTGTADATAALARVHLVNAAPAATRPLAAIDWARNHSSTREADGTHAWFTRQGTLSLLLRDTIATSTSDEDAALDFLNKVGALWADMEALAGTSGYLDIQSIRIVQGPERPEEDEVKALAFDFYQVVLAVEFRAP